MGVPLIIFCELLWQMRLLDKDCFFISYFFLLLTDLVSAVLITVWIIVFCLYHLAETERRANARNVSFITPIYIFNLVDITKLPSNNSHGQQSWDKFALLAHLCTTRCAVMQLHLPNLTPPSPTHTQHTMWKTSTLQFLLIFNIVLMERDKSSAFMKEK